jgi:GTP-binding protein HflX
MAHPQYEDHLRTVNETLKDLGALEKPTILVFNKIDLYRERYFDDLLEDKVKQDIERDLKANLKNEFEHDNIFISAVTKENMEELREKVLVEIKKMYHVRYPYRSYHW